MANLISLAEYKSYSGLPSTATPIDAQITALLPLVTSAILAYTERDFGSPLITEDRLFEYDGSGYLDIDDAANVFSVEIQVPQGTPLALTVDEWVAMPTRRDDQPVYYYILMPGFSGGISGEMGFTRNLDVLLNQGRYRTRPLMVEVNAQWGWPVIPDAVKLAANWTMQDWLSRSSGEGLTSEAIEGYARSWARGAGASEAMAIPPRARDLLALFWKPTA
jgi:hypothetical protein